MKVIILAGGSGVRLWPQSREQFPKQFLKIGEKESLLQRTIRRFLRAFSLQDLVIVCPQELKSLLIIQLKQIDEALLERVALEPGKRNTAPAILCGLKWLEERKELDSMFLVSPSDQVISPEELFLEKIQSGYFVVEKRQHLLFGIYPTSPHTGYGYIRCAVGADSSLPGSFSVKEFIEKPSKQKAQQLLIEGNVFWNSGIFLFHTCRFFEELLQFQPTMEAIYRDDFYRHYEKLPALSIDYALIEKLEHLHVLALPLSWSDVGSWDGVYDILPKDLDQNVLLGDVVTHNVERCLVHGDKKLIALSNVENLIVIDTPDALLIVKRESSQQIRSLVEDLQRKGRRELYTHQQAEMYTSEEDLMNPQVFQTTADVQ